MNKKEVKIEASDKVQDLGNNMVKINNKTYNTKYYKVIGLDKVKQSKSATPKTTDTQQRNLSFSDRSKAMTFLIALGKDNNKALITFFTEVMTGVLKE